MASPAAKNHRNILYCVLESTIEKIYSHTTDPIAFVQLVWIQVYHIRNAGSRRPKS
jgi:hypothetical protein